jgi:DNA-binding MarR family transcriptional regulator
MSEEVSVKLVGAGSRRCTLHIPAMLHSVLERAEPELSSLELDAKRLFILCTVEAHPFPADLARALSLPKPSMTFLVKKLEESGYLRRQGGKK